MDRALGRLDPAWAGRQVRLLFGGSHRGLRGIGELVDDDVAAESGPPGA